MIYIGIAFVAYMTGFFFGKKWGEEKILRDSIGVKIRFLDEAHEHIGSMTYYFSDKIYEEDLNKLRELEDEDHDEQK